MVHGCEEATNAKITYATRAQDTERTRHGDFTQLPDPTPSRAHDMDPVGSRADGFWSHIRKWIMLTTGPLVVEPVAVQPLNATLIPSATLMF